MVGSASHGSDRAELSSLASLLDELTARLVTVGDGYRNSPDSVITAELESVERTLLAARRALERTLIALGGGPS